MNILRVQDTILLYFCTDINVVFTKLCGLINIYGVSDTIKPETWRQKPVKRTILQ